jgi:hypothetical protein
MLCIEGVCIFEVGIPRPVNRGKEELGCATLGRFVAGKVIQAGAVGCFPTDSDDGRCIVGFFYPRAVGSSGEGIYCHHGWWHTSQGP